MTRHAGRTGTLAAAAFFSLIVGLACQPNTTRRPRTDAAEGGGGGAGGAGGMTGGAGGRDAAIDAPATGGRGGTGGADGGADAPGDAPRDTARDVAADARPPDARPPDARPPDARDGAAGDAAPAPTFTQLYNDYFGKVASPTVIGCRGPACHDVNREGFICSSKNNCYDSIKIRAEDCEPDECIITEVLKDGIMPKGNNRKFSASDLAKVKAWISAGVKNN